VEAEDQDIEPAEGGLMPEVLPAARELARRVLLHEAGGHPEPAALAEAAGRADARLRGRLADLVGITGYATLVARAVHLAQSEVPALERVTVDVREAAGVEGGLRGVQEFALASDGDPAVVEAALTAILAHVVGLLVTFIGEGLAIRLIGEAWPELVDAQDNAEGRA